MSETKTDSKEISLTVPTVPTASTALEVPSSPTTSHTVNTLRTKRIEIRGNLLRCAADVICHQVNCTATKGHGLSAHVANEFKDFNNYADHRFICVSP